jgi:hypothetical protein
MDATMRGRGGTHRLSKTVSGELRGFAQAVSDAGRYWWLVSRYTELLTMSRPRRTSVEADFSRYIDCAEELAASFDALYTTRVVWADADGWVGLGSPSYPPISSRVRRLRSPR